MQSTGPLLCWRRLQGMLCKVRRASLQSGHSSNPAPGSVPRAQEMLGYLLGNELMNPILMHYDIFILTGITRQIFNIKDFFNTFNIFPLFFF